MWISKPNKKSLVYFEARYKIKCLQKCFYKKFNGSKKTEYEYQSQIKKV